MATSSKLNTVTRLRTLSKWHHLRVIAESLERIQQDPTNPKLFTNRAMARLKLQNWDGVINDCIKCIEYDPRSMKGFFYLAQAQLALRRPNEAYCSAMTAYERCIETQDRSASSVSALVLQAKKLKWEVREKERLRVRNDLRAELEEGLVKIKKGKIWRLKEGGLDPDDEAEEELEIEHETQEKIDELRTVFALADPENMQRVLFMSFAMLWNLNAEWYLQEVPDYLIDNISFAIMHDPVVTKTGNSYDRSTVMEHLRRSATDPLTREPLRMEDLRPNLALKQACEAFLDENGWAVDW